MESSTSATSVQGMCISLRPQYWRICGGSHQSRFKKCVEMSIGWVWQLWSLCFSSFVVHFVMLSIFSYGLKVGRNLSLAQGIWRLLLYHTKSLRNTKWSDALQSRVLPLGSSPKTSLVMSPRAMSKMWWETHIFVKSGCCTNCNLPSSKKKKKLIKSGKLSLTLNTVLHELWKGSRLQVPFSGYQPCFFFFFF